MQQEQGNLYQFLYYVTLVVTFKVNSWPDSIFSWFYRLEISFNSDKKWSNLLSANNTKYSQLSTDSADSYCRANTRNQWKCSNIKVFSFFFIEILTLFRMGVAKRPSTTFSSVNSTNVELSPENFLAFSFNPFVTLV